ncbi:hypothetical protein H6G33_18940 [Calothrix sp. FACHB-1219]|uniref:hypothetical protein n=1 Tax=unclassified Calothrix TaxID=2619626 RepID=UPI0016865A57|nr:MULTISPECIES: hypothetical protein [unclassified Calothrix]MBD2203510.1 hypothetical protein [Calothrix sp. FACHB-168]MBD2219102.1 hypothetical protein [Calothrix sp. FACHB-1219]
MTVVIVLFEELILNQAVSSISNIQGWVEVRETQHIHGVGVLGFVPQPNLHLYKPA